MNRRDFLKKSGRLGLTVPLVGMVGRTDGVEQDKLKNGIKTAIGSRVKDKAGGERYFSKDNFSLRSAYCYSCRSRQEEVALIKWEDYKRGHRYRMLAGMLTHAFRNDDIFAICPNCQDLFAYLSVTCGICGHKRQIDQCHDNAPLECPACAHVLEIQADGLKLHNGQLGDWVGQYGFCGNCSKLTLNIPLNGTGKMSDKMWKDQFGMRKEVYAQWGTRLCKFTKETAGCLFTKCQACGEERWSPSLLPLDKCANVKYI